MNPVQIFEHIESHEFEAALAVANTVETFLGLAQGDQRVSELLRLTVDRPENATALLDRTQIIAREQGDFRYRHAKDGAIAVYTWTLAQANAQLAQAAASIALNLPRLWWAKKIAAAIISGQQTARQSSHTTVTSFPRAAPESTFASDHRNTIIIMDPSAELAADHLLDPRVISAEGHVPAIVYEDSGAQYSPRTNASGKVVILR